MIRDNIKVSDKVERWGVFEAVIEGKQDGNPFIDYQITGTFKSQNECKTADGFYDGDGIYIIRFMPSFAETYTYEITGSFSDEAYSGSFEALEPQSGNHGPVRVAETFHFAYEDGTPYYCFGTTCYGWVHQTEALKAETLASLGESCFNKLRFCIFPKHYIYNFNDPALFPFEGTPCQLDDLNEFTVYRYFGNKEGNNWDFERFNPLYFRNLDRAVQALMEAGMEADMIIMHAYDRWGFSVMDAESDDRYIKYITARYSAYRNVWWSLANEYDLLHKKETKDWERYAAIICEKDPYMHLRSIHNATRFYDYRRPWITHCSIQRVDIYKTTEYTDDWRTQYGKPVVLDEIGYEGTLTQSWGNISGPEMTRRFWEGALRGGYPGHSETLISPGDIIWWSHGGKLLGESHHRMQFLREIVEAAPGHGLRRMEDPFGVLIAVSEDKHAEMLNDHAYFLYYFGLQRPSFYDIYVDDRYEYRFELIDTWNMTIEDCGVQKGRMRVMMPGREYMAIRVQRVG